MPVRVDRDSDTLYIFLPDVDIIQRREVGDGIVAGYNAEGRVSELEVRKASKRKNTSLSGIVETLEEARKSGGPITKQPHYVWAFHLRAWADLKGRIKCCLLTEKKFFCPSSESVAKESYFYKTHRLSDGDIAYLNWLAGKASLPGLAEENRSTIQFFQEVYDVDGLLKELGLGEVGAAIFDEHVKFTELMLGERFHGAIENIGKPFLESLRLRDASFAANPSSFHQFIFFLNQQLFRTAKIRKSILKAFKRSPIPNHDPQRTGPIEQYIYANNVSAGMIEEIYKYKLVFLFNDNEIPFITGDQPVINLRLKETDDMKLYYPISPSIAILICSDVSHHRQISAFEVEMLNYKIFEACEEQVYSSNMEYLRNIVRLGRLDLSV